jgi:hypothetical protein
MKRNRTKPTETLQTRLQKFAADSREAAQKLTVGKERNDLLAKAERAETTAHLQALVSSPGLQPPK